MIPSKQERAEWRAKAILAYYISAIDEYCPAEFIVLLDALDELEQKGKFPLQAACEITDLTMENDRLIDECRRLRARVTELENKLEELTGVDRDGKERLT